MEQVLQVSKLQTQFFTHDGTVAAVNDVSFDVAAGEMLGVVGESGCGKSTIALSMMRLLPPQGKITGGRILLEDQDIVSLSERRMRRVRGCRMAMIFQDSLAALNPTLKVGRQLMEPLQIHLGLPAAKARKQAIELLAQVGIPAPETRLSAYAHELSGGMRQRAMIAIALACKPRMLIADEPTTALDVTVQNQILDLMLRLRDETRAGVIMITHDVGVVAQSCDRVVVMYAGKMVESGPTEAVFRNPRHYYTRGLLGATLDLDRGRQQALMTIPGLPPNLTRIPPGCAFWPRCEAADERCRTKTPTLETMADGHQSACWHAEMLASGTPLEAEG